MITTEIALYSASIGAIAGVLSQIVANALRDKTDKQKAIFECISEERKLAHLLFIHARRIEQSLLSIEYYFQLAVIDEGTKYEEPNLARHHEEIKFCGDNLKDHSILMGDYSKNIYKLMLYIGESKEMENVLSSIIEHKFEDSIEIYKNYKKYPELFQVYDQDHKLIDAKLIPYKRLFQDMRQNIQSITARYNEDY